jgi:hypothetical protein
MPRLLTIEREATTLLQTIVEKADSVHQDWTPSSPITFFKVLTSKVLNLESNCREE